MWFYDLLPQFPGGSLTRCMLHLGHTLRRILFRFVDLLDAPEKWAENHLMKSRHYYRVALQAGRALSKFCIDHGRPYSALDDCIKAIEAGDARAARLAFRSIHWVGPMSFTDWFPPPMNEHETPDYASAVLDALTTRFCQLTLDLLDLRVRGGSYVDKISNESLGVS